MFVVVLCEIVGTVEAEAQALARDLGTTAYEERLALAAGLPAIVMLSNEKTPAAELTKKIRGRGQGVVAFDAGLAAPSDAMISIRDFRLDVRGITAADTGDLLPFSDLFAIVRAVHKSRSDSRVQVKEKKFSAGRALLTGGLMLTKSTTKEQRVTSHEAEQVIYLFRASGETPWIVRERGAIYTGLGADLKPSSAQSFQTLIAKLRESAPHAVYDERLAAPGAVSGKALRAVMTKGGTQSFASAVDLLAHATLLWARKKAMGELS